MLCAVIEWIEANLFGWKIPGEDDMMPVYKQLALYYPEEHAYTFDSYRYGLGRCLPMLEHYQIGCCPSMHGTRITTHKDTAVSGAFWYSGTSSICSP